MTKRGQGAVREHAGHPAAVKLHADVPFACEEDELGDTPPDLGILPRAEVRISSPDGRVSQAEPDGPSQAATIDRVEE